jgi:hypothetical protein
MGGFDEIPAENGRQAAGVIVPDDVVADEQPPPKSGPAAKSRCFPGTDERRRSRRGLLFGWDETGRNGIRIGKRCQSAEEFSRPDNPFDTISFFFQNSPAMNPA